MAEPGPRSRIGFRLMALLMPIKRRSQATEGRVRASGVREGMTVLDYACGPGWFAVVAARIVGPAGFLYAVDVQPAAVRMTADRARAAGLDNVVTIVSGRDTDVVLLYDAVQTISDRRAVLAELDRVLKPGGVLSLWVEHGAPEHAVPLVVDSSRFVPREQHGDILNFVRG